MISKNGYCVCDVILQTVLGPPNLIKETLRVKNDPIMYTTKQIPKSSMQNGNHSNTQATTNLKLLRICW